MPLWPFQPQWSEVLQLVCGAPPLLFQLRGEFSEPDARHRVWWALLLPAIGVTPAVAPVAQPLDVPVECSPSFLLSSSGQ